MPLFFSFLTILAITVTLIHGVTLDLRWLTLLTISPYVCLLYLLKISQHKTAKMIAMFVSVFIVSVGLYFLLDTTYMERRLDYKFSFLFIPLWQWTILIVSGLVIYLSNDKQNES